MGCYGEMAFEGGGQNDTLKSLVGVLESVSETIIVSVTVQQIQLPNSYIFCAFSVQQITVISFQINLHFKLQSCNYAIIMGNNGE